MGKVKTGAYNPLPVVPIVLVGSNVNGNPNYMAVGFVNGVNIKPAMVCISLNKEHYTPKGILENGTFSINVPCANYVIETDYCGLVSGKHTDKSRIFTTFYGELKTAPMIEEFPITCECRYTGQKVEFDMDTVYFGEVIQVYVREEVLGENGKINVLKADPIYYSGIENRYRRLGKDIGPGWRIGKQYIPQQNAPEPESPGKKYRCDIVERSARPALTIRTRVSPAAMPLAIQESVPAIIRYAGEKGYTPTGPFFVAYRDFDGHLLDIEIGFPFESGIEGGGNITLSEIPGGKSASYHHLGSYQKLPEVRTALEYWLKTNGFMLSGVTYEFYLNDPQITDPENLETDIVYPLLSES